MASSSELPEDILMLILAGLDVPDLVRAGSVCSAWHGAYTSLCNLGRWKQTPCLLYYTDDDRSHGQSAAACLYSLAEKKPYTLALPDPPICSRYLIGSAHGWVVTADERSELHLVNPVTGDQIALPSVTTMEHVVPVHGADGALKEYRAWTRTCCYDKPRAIRVFGLGELRKEFFKKALLSSDPSTGNCIVALIHNLVFNLSFARTGDDRWTWLPGLRSVQDCVFKDGILYTLTQRQEIRAFDFSGPAVEQKLILEQIEGLYVWDRMYIVQAPSGDLLQIRVAKQRDSWESTYSAHPELFSTEEAEFFSLIDQPFPTFSTRFQVFRVDLEAKRFVAISSLDESVLFLGQGQSLCLLAEGYPQLKANHVYFTDEDRSMFLFGRNTRPNIGVVCLGNTDVVENITSTQIWSKWPCLLWITPNPRKMNSVRSRSTPRDGWD